MAARCAVSADDGKSNASSRGSTTRRRRDYAPELDQLVDDLEQYAGLNQQPEG
jgi:hypothetical protein